MQVREAKLKGTEECRPKHSEKRESNMEKLRQFVHSLNSCDNTAFVYIDPKNPDNFVVRSRDWGVPEGYRLLGSLESLTPTINFCDELKEYLISRECTLTYQGKKVKASPEGIVENFDWLDAPFTEFLEEEMKEWIKAVREVQADFILDKLFEELAEEVELEH